jgi:tRNA-specific 2-thiouridylase
MKTVVVGMSGGVDSSVSALLLKRAGYRVIGLFMKNWEETDPNGACHASKDLDDVAKVCDQIDIPHYTVRFVEEYQERVFATFLADLKAGLTPNPDILCNKEIKFDLLLEKAKEMGADFLATGHYCQTDGSGQLLKGLDPSKDQSYFLHAVNSKALQSTLFPIGHLLKSEVRKIAKENDLATSEKKDSTGICFIGKRDFKSFISAYLPYQNGPFKQLSGEVVGKHDGAAFYTIGQRKGLGLGGEGDAWYVVGKDVAQNVVYVERGENHPALYSSHLKATQLKWIDPPSQASFACAAKVRYRQKDEPCKVHLQDGVALVQFDQPQRAITSGQSVVFYSGEKCLGGGIIR